MKRSARIARLEQRFLTEGQLDLKSLTFDELAVMLLDASRDAAANESLSQDQRRRAADQVAKLEAGVRWQAALARLPAYAAALDQLCQQIPGFVRAIFCEAGSKDAKAEIRDLDKQRVMERRACLRMRPDIRDLIEAGARENAPVEFDDRFVATAVLGRPLVLPPVRDTDSSGGMGDDGIL
jgi:hypothetical protein